MATFVDRPLWAWIPADPAVGKRPIADTPGKPAKRPLCAHFGRPGPTGSFPIADGWLIPTNLEGRSFPWLRCPTSPWSNAH